MLLDAVQAFTDLHPQVHFDVLASDRFSQLVDERVDIALRFTQQPDENLIARRLLEVGMVVCATQEYLAQHAPIELPQDLTHHNCLVHISGNNGISLKITSSLAFWSMVIFAPMIWVPYAAPH